MLFVDIFITFIKTIDNNEMFCFRSVSPAFFVQPEFRCDDEDSHNTDTYHYTNLHVGIFHEHLLKIDEIKSHLMINILNTCKSKYFAAKYRDILSIQT